MMPDRPTRRPPRSSRRAFRRWRRKVRRRARRAAQRRRSTSPLSWFSPCRNDDQWCKTRASRCGRRPETVRGVPALQPLPNDDDVSEHGDAEEDERKRLALSEVAFEHHPPLLLLKLLQFLQFAHSSPPAQAAIAAK